MASHKFKGKDRFLRNLARLPYAVREEARAALDDQTDSLLKKIKPRIPREEGHLADSLEWHRNPRRDKISNVITEGRKQPKDPKNRKARAVEFGRPDMAAQPHFYPTYRANKKSMRLAMVRRVRAMARKIWGSR